MVKEELEVRAYNERRDYQGFIPSLDKTSRTISLSFGSETPVQRVYGWEVLSCRDGDVDLTRLQDNGPLLLQHDPSSLVGKITEAWVSAGVARAKALLSKNAEHLWSDLEDGIISHTSVGYEVTELISKEETTDGTVYRWKWRPLEVSLVSIPADPDVGVGRSYPQNTEKDRTSSACVVEVKENLKEKRKMETEVKNDAAEIAKLAKEHGFLDLGADAIAEGQTLDGFRGRILGEIAKRSAQPPAKSDVPDVDKKDLKGYSIRKAILSIIPGSGIQPGLEMEVSNYIAQKTGRGANGIYVPHTILTRDVVKSTSTGLVQTDVMSSEFIDALRDKMVTARAGVKVLSGLVGDITVPKLTTSSTCYWVGEASAVTESSPVVGAVSSSPKTCGTFIDLSRKLLKQSSVAVDELLIEDLTRTISTAIDGSVLTGAGTNEPTGVMNHGDKLTGSVTLDAPEWHEIIGVEAQIMAQKADVGPMAWILSPNAWSLCAGTPTSTGASSYLADIVTKTMGGNPFYVSSLMTTKKGVLGCFADAVKIALWGAIDLNYDSATLSSAGGLRVVALSDLDVIVRQGKSFSVCTFIT